MLPSAFKLHGLRFCSEAMYYNDGIPWMIPPCTIRCSISDESFVLFKTTGGMYYKTSIRPL